ncbi:MAG: long-chain fatty acid transporter [Bacteroidetes bacterium]|nr:long-chain fatty acid transporter [Bacteroidota bacterium]MDA1121628.1 long-chain fatty acid transporter [Bacteroidota bacterium]
MKNQFRLISVSIAIALSTTLGNAQINPEALGLYNEALKFSRTRFNGSARIQGMGGVQTALGGDLSSALANPAGLGFYNRSEFSFTPSLNFHRSDADFEGRSALNETENFNFNQLGAVFNKPNQDDESDFRSATFAISLTRTNDFRQEFNYDSQNFATESSIIDFFLEQANGIPANNINGLMAQAYDTYLINPLPAPAPIGEYDSFVVGFPRQIETVKTTGSQYQWSFAAGANYKDQLYFGGNIGFSTINYKVKKSFIENDFIDSQGNPDVIDNIMIDEKLDLNGIGVNATFGLIYRPISQITLGLSYTTPSWYEINKESFSDLEVNYRDYYYIEEDTLLSNLISPQGDLLVSNYSLRTPSKLNIGMSYFFGKSGFLTADVEMVDYSNANLKSDDFSPTADNETICDLYDRVINFRLGTEWRYDNFRFRGGYAYWADPIKGALGDNDRQNLTFGLGYRSKKFFADFAVITSLTKEAYSPYFLANGTQPSIKVENKSTNAVVTIGFGF